MIARTPTYRTPAYTLAMAAERKKMTVVQTSRRKISYRTKYARKIITKIKEKLRYLNLNK